MGSEEKGRDIIIGTYIGTTLTQSTTGNLGDVALLEDV